MPVETVLAFLLTSIIIELTPGPNMLYLAVLSLGRGRRAGLAAVAGIAIGLLGIGLAAAVGVATLVASSTVLYEALRWAGVAYLLWLAWEGWQDARETSPHQTELPVDDAKFFSRGLITNLLNPKAGVFYVAILPTFLSPNGSPIFQSVLLATLYVAVASVIHAAIVVIADRIKPFLEDAETSRRVRQGLSLVLAVIAVWFAVATAR